MENSIFKFIFKHSKRQQIALVLFTFCSFPFLYATLDLPKIIVNEAIGADSGQFPLFLTIPFTSIGFEFSQVSYLMLLSFTFLGLVLINGGFKYKINVYKGQLGERMLRRLRYDLYVRLLRFRLPHFKKVSSGEIIPIVTAEVEPLGGFIGDAFALPVFQGGTLLVYLTFIFLQDPLLGLAAILLYPFQLYVIPKLQKQVNQLGKKRIKAVRKLSDRIGETVTGIKDIHANDTTKFERSDISYRLGNIYHIRYDIFRKKFFIKFLNNFLAQLTPFFFFSVGGYFVIIGDLTFGALVAVLAAYKDLASPWKELLAYYQQKEDVKIKYQQIIELFQPPDLRNQSEIDEETIIDLNKEIIGKNISYIDDEETKILDKISFEIQPHCSYAILGTGYCGKDEFALLLSGLLSPTMGRLKIDEHSFDTLPESSLGQKISYVDSQAQFFNGTIKENLLYSLKHKALGDPPQSTDEEKWQYKECLASGNSPYSIKQEWINYQAVDCKDFSAVQHKIIDIIEDIGLGDDIYNLGLKSTVDKEKHTNLADKILLLRDELKNQIEKKKLGNLVEQFDIESYNDNSTVAENLLFGTALTDEYSPDHLAQNELVLSILHQVRLYDEFLYIGFQAAEIMVELFAELDSETSDEFIEQYSFIDADLLEKLKHHLGSYKKENLHDLSDDNKALLLTIPFKLIVTRHRLGLITLEIKEKILKARTLFFEKFSKKQHNKIALFNPEKYDYNISIQDNVLFGRIAHNQPQAEEKIYQLIFDLISKEGLRKEIINVGLDSQVGPMGSRLSQTKKQKLAIVRALIKNPDIIVFNQALSAVDQSLQKDIVLKILETYKNKTIIWVLNRVTLSQHFDNLILLKKGKIIDQGSFDMIAQKSQYFREIVPALSKLETT